MSVHIFDRVWKHSVHTGTELLMLLAIADFADDDGNAYPSVGTLARKCRMTPRNANLLLAALRTSGELQVHPSAGPKGVNRYRIVLNGRAKAPAEKRMRPSETVFTPEADFIPEVDFTSHEADFPKPLKPASTKPSLNRQRGGAHASHAPAATQDSGRGSRLPDDWTLPAEWRKWAAEIRADLDLDAVAEAFADYWRAQPGAKGRKADWFATWRNWVRNERAGTGRTALSISHHNDTTYNFADEVSQ